MAWIGTVIDGLVRLWDDDLNVVEHYCDGTVITVDALTNTPQRDIGRVIWRET